MEIAVKGLISEGPIFPFPWATICAFYLLLAEGLIHLKAGCAQDVIAQELVFPHWCEEQIWRKLKKENIVFELNKR